MRNDIIVFKLIIINQKASFFKFKSNIILQFKIKMFTYLESHFSNAEWTIYFTRDCMHVVFLLGYISSHSYVTHHLHIFFYLTKRVHLPKNNEIVPILTKQNLQKCLNLKINIALSFRTDTLL